MVFREIATATDTDVEMDFFPLSLSVHLCTFSAKFLLCLNGRSKHSTRLRHESKYHIITYYEQALGWAFWLRPSISMMSGVMRVLAHTHIREQAGSVYAEYSQTLRAVKQAVNALQYHHIYLSDNIEEWTGPFHCAMA